nr:(Fe-S)-binding protein [Candidatus Sigynarchaeum springense]
MTRIQAFDAGACTRCGTCLQQCPVLRYAAEEAKAEIQKLIARQPSSVLARCNSCFSCNLYCEQHANPYQLILENWNALYQARKAPPLYKFVCPTEEPNIWQLLNAFLSPAERRWVKAWMDYEPKPGDTVLLVGNYTHLFPFIIGGSKLLRGFKLVDRIDQWEGGAYLYQGGYLDVVRLIARNAETDFKRWKPKKIVPFLDAVHYIFTEVHPKEMGVRHEHEFENFNKWLLSEVESGRLNLPNKLGIKVTVHDNCYSKVMAGEAWDVTRKILKKCGCHVVEMEHHKRDSLCCGFGAGASWVKNMSIPFDILYEGRKKFKEAMATGADGLVSYCGGCIYLLWAAKELFDVDIDVYHVFEIVRMAAGEKLDYPRQHEKRAWDIIAIITYQLAVSLLQRPFPITKLSYDKERSTFTPRNVFALKAIRLLFNSGLVRGVYRKMFSVLMNLLKTRK